MKNRKSNRKSYQGGGILDDLIAAGGKKRTSKSTIGSGSLEGPNITW